MRKVPEEVFVQQILERQKWRKRTILSGPSSMQWLQLSQVARATSGKRNAGQTMMTPDEVCPVPPSRELRCREPLWIQLTSNEDRSRLSDQVYMLTPERADRTCSKRAVCLVIDAASVSDAAPRCLSMNLPQTQRASFSEAEGASFSLGKGSHRSASIAIVGKTEKSNNVLNVRAPLGLTVNPYFPNSPGRYLL